MRLRTREHSGGRQGSASPAQAEQQAEQLQHQRHYVRRVGVSTGPPALTYLLSTLSDQTNQLADLLRAERKQRTREPK